MAFFAAFAALAVTPSSQFGVIATIPLAGALLYLADRFRWYSMALFGMVATYLTCVAHGGSDSSLVASETLFVVYWCLFEGFDILRARRQEVRGGVEWIFPGNAIGFLTLSKMLWSEKASGELWVMSAIAAALYLFSAVARWPRSPQEDKPLAARFAAGGFEAPFLLSAVLGGLSIAGRVPGIWKSVGFAAEAELVYLAGLRLQSGFIRKAGARAFAISLLRLVFSQSQEATSIYGGAVYVWTPAALFHVFLFHLNRFIRVPNAIFSSLGSLLLATVIAAELPQQFAGLGLEIFGLGLFAFGLRRQFSEFRDQGYAVSAVGVATVLYLNTGMGTTESKIAAALSLVLIWAVTAFANQLEETERFAVEIGLASGIPLVMAVLLYVLVPAGYLGLSWAAGSVLLWEAGKRNLPATLRPAALIAVGIAAFWVIQTHHANLGHFTVPVVWLSYWGAAAALHWVALCQGQGVARTALASAGTVFLLPALWLVVSGSFVAGAWAALAVILVIASRQFARPDLRWQALGVAVVTFLWALINPPATEYALLAPALFFALQFLLPRDRTRTAVALLATTLVTKLLFNSVRGGLLTIAWGAEGLLLLAAGFPARERILRLAGLALFLVCILKLFIYDLRTLDTMYRILSFVALGLILLAVSWIYTRFRERIRRYL